MFHMQMFGDQVESEDEDFCFGSKGGKGRGKSGDHHNEHEKKLRKKGRKRKRIDSSAVNLLDGESIEKREDVQQRNKKRSNVNDNPRKSKSSKRLSSESNDSRSNVSGSEQTQKGEVKGKTPSVVPSPIEDTFSTKRGRGRPKKRSNVNDNPQPYEL